MTGPISDQAGAERYVLYACRSGYAGEVAEIVLRLGGTIEALVDNVAGEVTTSVYGPVIGPADLAAAHHRLAVVVPLLTPGYRMTVVEEARAHGLQRFPRVVDPTSTVASTATLDEGTVINAGAVVGASSRVGAFVHVNRSASLAHDLDIHDWVSVGPGATLSGSVVVERGVFIGAGAVVTPQVSIGRNSIVGAGAVVVRNVPEHVVVAGNPAKVVRDGIAGYGDVGV